MHSTQRWLSQDTVLLAGHNLPGTGRKSWLTLAGCNLGNYPSSVAGAGAGAGKSLNAIYHGRCGHI